MFQLCSSLLHFFFHLSTYFTPSLVLLSHEQPRGVPEGHQRLQDANSTQMPQFPLPNHAEVLERRSSRQARLQVPQGPTGQQPLRTGVSGPNVLQDTLHSATEGQQRAWQSQKRWDVTKARIVCVCNLQTCKFLHSLFIIQKSDDLLFLLKL